MEAVEAGCLFGWHADRICVWCVDECAVAWVAGTGAGAGEVIALTIVERIFGDRGRFLGSVHTLQPPSWGVHTFHKIHSEIYQAPKAHVMKFHPLSFPIALLFFLLLSLLLK